MKPSFGLIPIGVAHTHAHAMHTHTRARKRTQTRVRKFTHTRARTRTHTHTQTHTHLRLQTHTHTRAQTHTHARAQIHTHTRAQIHTLTHARANAHTVVCSRQYIGGRVFGSLYEARVVQSVCWQQRWTTFIIPSFLCEKHRTGGPQDVPWVRRLVQPSSLQRDFSQSS